MDEGRIDRNGHVAVPEDFRHVLSEVPGAQHGWQLLTAEEQAAHVARLEGAVDEPDRKRRIDESIQELVQQLPGKPVVPQP